MSIFISDSFTEPSDIGLLLHTGELATWADHPHVNYGGDFTVDAASDRVYSSSVGAAAVFANNWTPASADYYVQADFVHVSTLSQNIAICLRMHETADTMYIVRLNSGTTWEMRRIIAGAATTLTGGTSTNQIPSVGNFATGKFVAQGDQLSFYVNGVLEIGPITDTNITAAGRAGLRNSGAASSSTGLHLDNFEAGTLGEVQGDPSFRPRVNRPALFLPGIAR